ncbi:hypothetical protein DINM_006397 [Dirofilaria immitis]|nr:hypothetical protein [Dirofilaria immitis]
MDYWTPSRKKNFAEQVMHWLEDRGSHEEEIELAAQYAAWRDKDSCSKGLMNDDMTFKISPLKVGRLSTRAENIGDESGKRRGYSIADLAIHYVQLLDTEYAMTVSREETCSLNSTSISIDHSRDSILDFSICSNPIDEAAIMEEQLAASGELSDDIPVMARSTATTLSSYTPKDTGHSLTNRTIFTTATAVASTTGSNCQPVSPSASSFITASLPPLLFNAPPIASLEDLTSGEQNSDITTARSDFATSSATNFDFNRVRKDDLKGRGRIEQGVGNGKDADDDDNDDVNGRSDYYRQTSASTTIKRYIIRSGWFFRPYQHARPLN